MFFPLRSSRFRRAAALRPLAFTTFAAAAAACAQPPDGSPAARERPSAAAQADAVPTPVCPTPYSRVTGTAGVQCAIAQDPALPPLAALDVAAAGTTTYAIRPDGSVVAWGNLNMLARDTGATSGAGAPPTVDQADTPTPIGVTQAVQVAAGDQGGCALLSSGGVTCWGSYDLRTVNAPAAVPLADGTPLTGVVSMTHGYAHACALTSAGTVLCWGNGTDGELGDGQQGRFNVHHEAREIVDPSATRGTAVQVAASGRTTCVLYADHHVSCFGDNTYGSLGIGAGGHHGPQPVQPLPAVGTTLGAVDRIVAGNGPLGTFCVHVPGGAAGAEAIECWGANDEHQLDPSGSEFDAAHPVSLQDGAARAFSSSGGCGWTVDGYAQCWGAFGDGTAPSKTYVRYAPSSAPNSWVRTFVGGAFSTSAPADVVQRVAGVLKVAVGATHACAITRDALVCWGDNAQGQLGLGESAPALHADIQIPQGFARVTCPQDRRFAVVCDGAHTSCGCDLDPVYMADGIARWQYPSTSWVTESANGETALRSAFTSGAVVYVLPGGVFTMGPNSYAKYAAMGGASYGGYGPAVGFPTQSTAIVPDPGSGWASETTPLEHGRVYWSNYTSAYVMVDAMLPPFDQQNTVWGIGYPIDDMVVSSIPNDPWSTLAEQHFQRGSIIASSAYGSYWIGSELTALIDGRNASGSRTALNANQADATGYGGDAGHWVRTSSGLGLWSPGTGAHFVPSAIENAYSSNDFATIGFPTSDATPAQTDSRYVYQTFKNGVVFANPSTGEAHSVYGLFWDNYRAAGGEHSCLGIPTTNVQETQPVSPIYATEVQYFRAGYMHYGREQWFTGGPAVVCNLH